MNVGEYGKPIVGFFGVDVSSADTLQMILTKPDGTSSTKTATAGDYTRVLTDGSSYAAGFWGFYLTQTGDIDVAGRWSVQAVATWTATKVLKSEQVPFWVES